MTEYEPDNEFRAALTALDLGKADLIITPADFVADWAENHGYCIVRATTPKGWPVFEIRRLDDQPVAFALFGAARVPSR